MLEIIALFSLGKTIRNIAISKGLKPTRFIIHLVLLWIACEMLGASVGAYFFPNNFFGTYCFAMLGAALGGFLGYQKVLHAPENTAQ